MQEQITLQLDKSNPCCEKMENLTPVLLVNSDGNTGVAHFCMACKHLFINQAQFMEFDDVNQLISKNGLVNVFTDMPKIQNMVARIQANIHYICYTDGVSDDGLTKTLGMEEVKFSLE